MNTLNGQPENTNYIHAHTHTHTHTRERGKGGCRHTHAQTHLAFLINLTAANTHWHSTFPIIVWVCASVCSTNLTASYPLTSIDPSPPPAPFHNSKHSYHIYLFSLTLCLFGCNFCYLHARRRHNKFVKLMQFAFAAAATTTSASQNSKQQQHQQQIQTVCALKSQLLQKKKKKR